MQSSNEQSDHLHSHRLTLIFFFSLLLCRRANTLFYCVRDAPVGNRVAKYVPVHNYIHTAVIISYSGPISTPIPGQNYIVSIYFGCLLLYNVLFVSLRYFTSFPCVFRCNALHFIVLLFNFHCTTTREVVPTLVFFSSTFYLFFNLYIVRQPPSV